MKKFLQAALALATLMSVLVAVPSNAAAQATCRGKPITVDIGAGDLPTSGDDVILGTSGDDAINALAGNDSICGLGGNDIINGGDGNDFISGGAGDDTLNGRDGNDIIRGTGGADIINGGTGDDRLYGDGGNDEIRGNAGNDILNGGGSHDRLWGDSGDDIIEPSPGNDIAWGGANNDTIDGGDGDDTLYGQSGDDTLTGGADSDTANGGGGTDLCDAETELQCLEPAPGWVHGSDVLRETVSSSWFVVSWCCHVGTATGFEVTVIDSQGNRDPWRNSLNGFNTQDNRWILEIDSFLGDPLLPGQTYRVEVRAENAAGMSEPITLEEVELVTIQWVSSDTIIEAPASGSTAGFTSGPSPHIAVAGQPGLHRTTGSIDAECFVLTTTFVGEIDAGIVSTAIFGDRIVRHSVTSEFCRDATSIIENVTDIAFCEVIFGQETDGPPLVNRSPESETPHVKKVRNIWTCPLDGEIGVPTDAGPVPVGLDFTIDLEAHHKIRHVVEVVGGKSEWTAEDWQP